MTQPETTSPGMNGPWPVLDLRERRALGVLVEKQKTTPDAYPMSLNALVTGGNQKSNRDPVLFLSEEDVEYTLTRLQKAGLVMKITGGRVERWRHTLYDSWHVGKVEMAVLGELLLRGPQTEGELRTRASRMEPIDDLDQLRQVLRPSGRAKSRRVSDAGGTPRRHADPRLPRSARTRSTPRSSRRRTGACQYTVARCAGFGTCRTTDSIAP